MLFIPKTNERLGDASPRILRLNVANRKTPRGARGGSGIPARRDISRSGERDAAPESNRLLNGAGRPSGLTAGWLAGSLVDSSAGAVLARPVGTTRFKLENPRAACALRDRLARSRGSGGSGLLNYRSEVRTEMIT